MNTPVQLPLAEPQMNATPLIDVLLVLLVMLIFTLPVATHAVKLNLPQGAPKAPMPRPQVTVNIDFDGQLFWNGVAVADHESLERKLREAAGSTVSTKVKVVPDKRVRYEDVAVVLAAAQRAGVTLLDVATVPY
jgi:biopolymer transport protein ExbD